MAKNKGESGEATEATEAAEPKVDKRVKTLTHPDTGETVRRVDYLRELCNPDGAHQMTRSQARDKYKEVTGEDIRYQIVFAATKDMDVKKAQRGKAPEAGAEVAAEAAVE